MRTLIPKTQVIHMNSYHVALIGCMQMSSYWGSGTAVGKIISLPARQPSPGLGLYLSLDGPRLGWAWASVGCLAGTDWTWFNWLGLAGPGLGWT